MTNCSCPSHNITLNQRRHSICQKHDVKKLWRRLKKYFWPFLRFQHDEEKNICEIFFHLEICNSSRPTYQSTNITQFFIFRMLAMWLRALIAIKSEFLLMMWLNDVFYNIFFAFFCLSTPNLALYGTHWG